MTFQNLGTATWDSTYSMVSRNPNLNTNWGVSSLPVSGTVAQNSNAVFTHLFTAPSTPGTYHFKWRMSVGASPFGEESSDLSVVVSADAAQWISTSSQPATIAAGKDFYAQYTMKNTGTTTWSSATGYSLALIAANNWSRTTINLPGGTFAPGASVLLTGLCTSSITPGTYPIQWQMQKSGVKFGEKTPLANIVVTLGPDDAQFISQSGVPTTIVHSTAFTPTITMKNLGTATWAGPTYALVPIGSSPFGVSSISAPSTAQNANGVFSATFTAPATPGTYTFQMRMVDGSTKFGQATTLVTITVT